MQQKIGKQYTLYCCYKQQQKKRKAINHKIAKFIININNKAFIEQIDKNVTQKWTKSGGKIQNYLNHLQILNRILFV